MALKKECVAAFKEGNLERALHYLPFVDKPELLRAEITLNIWTCEKGKRDSLTVSQY